MIKNTINKNELNKLVKKYSEMIPEIYPSNNFPKGFSLTPLDWALTEEDMEKKNIETVINGSKINIRPMLTMDLELLSNSMISDVRNDKIDLVKNYPCGLKCPGCFSQADIYGDKNKLLPWQDVIKTVDDGIEIGLKSVKFLGPGEMLQNPDLFNILDALKKRNIAISIFTKGAELGDDNLAKQIYKKDGINTAEELTQRIAEYDNVRILLGFNSFSSQRQNWMTGSLNKKDDYIITNNKFTSRGIGNYTKKRDSALVNLVEAGFNDGEQRLSLIAAPVHLFQSDEIPSMYLWAAKRNIPLVIAPTMESGHKSIGLQKANTKLDPNHKKLVNLMTSIYETAIDNGIIDFNTIKEEGISAYAGTAPCNQVTNGLYMRLNGQVQMCPGRSDEDAVYGNVHDTPLAEIWMNSPNYKMGEIKNNWCKAKVKGMPESVQKEVYKNLEKYVLNKK